MAEKGRLRIGELSKRVGVSPELLRAWETRYGLVDPERTPGGLRLYSKEDERRVREMRRQMAAGLSAAEAARVALGGPAEPIPPEQLLDQLDDALTALDEPAAQAALGRTFASLDLETALARVITPFLHELGERWAATERSVGQEHFASNVIGGKAAHARPRLGRRRRSLRAVGLPAGRAARARAALLRAPPARRRVEDRLPRGGDPARRGRDSGLGPLAGARGARRDDRAAVRRCRRRNQSGERPGPSGDRGAGASEALARSLGAELLAGDMVAAARAMDGAAS